MADQGLTGDATTVLPPESPQPEAASEPRETPEQLRERMREIAKRPRGPRKVARLGTETFRRRLLDEVESARRDPLRVKHEREVRAELKGKGLPEPKALIEEYGVAAAMVDYTTGAAFSAGLNGGVNRHKKRLHELTEQRRDLGAWKLSLRLRLGLDAESVQHPTTPSEAMRAAFAQLAEEENSPGSAEQLRAARERAAAHYEEDRKRHEAEMHEFAQRAIREAFEKAGVPMPVEPAALLSGPLPSPPPDDTPFEPMPTDERGIAVLSAEMQGVSDAMEEEMAEADALRANPSPTVPEPRGEFPHVAPDEPDAGPVLELEPENNEGAPNISQREPAAVEDLGNPRAMLPFVRQIEQDEPRFKPLRSQRVPGTRLWTDESGFILPHPDSL